MPYRCLNCGARFDEPYTKHTSYESYYGVSGMFGSSTPLDLELCPSCDDEDVEEFCDDERDE